MLDSVLILDLNLRRSDKVAAIRILVIESLGGILKSHSGLSQDIIGKAD
jgi:hypothetical protein